MGTIIQPVCSSCHEPYPRCLIGLGMLDMTNKFLAPYACDHCGTISFKSLHNKHHRCSKCRKQVILYGKTLGFMLPDDPDIHYEPEKVVIDVTVAMDLQYVLEDKNYHCPNCKKETLMFEEYGEREYKNCPHYSQMVDVLIEKVSLNNVGFKIEDISECLYCTKNGHTVCNLWISVLISNDLSEQVGIEGAEVTIQNLDKRNAEIAFALLKSFQNNSTNDANEEPYF